MLEATISHIAVIWCTARARTADNIMTKTPASRSIFETTPRRDDEQREPQTILKTDARSIHLELRRERKFNR